MMRNIAIGLAAATIAIGGSTLSGSALYGQESGISKGMSGSVQGEHSRGVARELADLTPLQRERLRGIMRERYEQVSPVERERYRRGPYGRR
jgi:Spy/CpxP family protein refolding chaperone